MALEAGLPPRVFERFREVFDSFVRQFRFPSAHLKVLSMASFVVACKVALTASSRGKTFT